MFQNTRLAWLCRSALFLVAAFLFFSKFQGAVLLAEKQCVDACGSLADCSTSCLDDFDQSITCGDYDGGASGGMCWAGYCGDGVCNQSAGEYCDNCSADCGTCLTPPPCGNGVCDEGETCSSCQADCGPCGDSGTCGDGQCQSDEGKSCVDCQMTGWCHTGDSCPSVNGNAYICEDHQCVLADLPDWTTTCSLDSDCWSGTCQFSWDYYGGNGGFVCLTAWYAQ